MSTDSDVSDEGIFRRQWRSRQSNRRGPGDMIVQPRWIGGGLAGLAGLLAAGIVSATTLTVARTASLPAVAMETAVTAVPSEDTPPVGAMAHFRDTSGATVDAVITESSATQVRARIPWRIPGTAGQLLVPDGRQRVISVLLPRLR